MRVMVNLELRARLKKIQREFFSRYRIGESIPDAEFNAYRERMRREVEGSTN